MWIVPLTVLKSKMTTVKITTVPFRVVSRQIWQKLFEIVWNCQSVSSCVVLELVPRRRKNQCEPCPSNEILVPFTMFFENSNKHPGGGRMIGLYWFHTTVKPLLNGNPREIANWPLSRGDRLKRVKFTVNMGFDCRRNGNFSYLISTELWK